jgi:hypothetical protein
MRGNSFQPMPTSLARRGSPSETVNLRSALQLLDSDLTLQTAQGIGLAQDDDAILTPLGRVISKPLQYQCHVLLRRQLTQPPGIITYQPDQGGFEGRKFIQPLLLSLQASLGCLLLQGSGLIQRSHLQRLQGR